MARRELSDPDGRPEQPSPGRGDSAVEQPSGIGREQDEAPAKSVPAETETMTREKYCDYVRSRGEPIPDHDQDDSRARGWGSGNDSGFHGLQHRGEGPPKADIDRWHALYRDYLRENPAGWDQGESVAEKRPDRFPADTSHLPPSGTELIAVEPRESRAAAFRQEFYQPEVIEGIHDTIEQNARNVTALFERPPTDSHVEVPASVPGLEAQHLEGINASDVTTAGFVLGVMAFELGRWGHNKWESLRGT
jgi:hypothetical protein